jgi:hypothetical protein
MKCLRACSINAIRNALPHFVSKKILVCMIFYSWFIYSLFWKGKQMMMTHMRYLSRLCSTSFHKSNCLVRTRLCSSQTTISVHIVFDARNKTGVIFYSFSMFTFLAIFEWIRESPPWKWDQCYAWNLTRETARHRKRAH